MTSTFPSTTGVLEFSQYRIIFQYISSTSEQIKMTKISYKNMWTFAWKNPIQICRSNHLFPYVLEMQRV